MKVYRKTAALLIMAAVIMASVNPMQAHAAGTGSAVYNADAAHLEYVTEAEDQEGTNYCWAYMADAVLESYLWKTGRAAHLDFSEEDMIFQLGGGGIYGFSDLTNGGSCRQALGYWTRGIQYGPRLEADSSLQDYYVSGTVDLRSYRIGDEQAKQNYIQGIKNLVAQYGAAGVSVYFNAYDRAQTTKNGAYYYPQGSMPRVNHGVTVVGWNDNFPAQWFYNVKTYPHQPQRGGAFLVKNSWGKNDASSISGSTGCYWISYENYFQDAFAVTQVVNRSELYEHIYETDYRGLAEYAPGSGYKQAYLLSSGTQQLTGFATYVKAGAYYRFYVNGQELTQFRGTMAQSGYRTFRLADPVKIDGTVLELRVEVYNDTSAVPIAYSSYASTPDKNNVCLKAFTSEVKETGDHNQNNPPEPDSSITGVTISPQDCTVRQGGQQVFRAQVLGKGQPSQQINWQLSGNSSQKTKLTANGILYVGEDESSSVLYVYANASANTSKSAEAKVTIQKDDKPAVNSYTVTFMSDGAVCGVQTVAGGTAAAAPALTKEGYSLSWDKDFQSVTSDLIVNAQWTKVPADEPTTPDSPAAPGSAEENNGDPAQIGILDKAVYSCLADGTACYTKCTAKRRFIIEVPEEVEVDGQTYKVTSLGDRCLRKNKKAAIVRIGKNITEIGEKAFFGCEKLKKVKIKSQQLTYIGSNAFRDIPSKAVIYVPRSCLAKYRTLVRESGNKTVRVKAYN